MDETKIIKMYTEEKMTLRQIANLLNSNHHTIKRILVKNNIQITRRNSLRSLTQEHRENISISRKKAYAAGSITPYNKGTKASKELRYKNMKSHLKYNVELEWLMQFDDIEKLIFLNRSITRSRDKIGLTDEIYMEFIEKFYDDSNFNRLYEIWLRTKDKWIKPSLDHIRPKAQNGELFVDNLRFISWFENRAKVDMSLNEWEDMKKRLYEYL